VQMNNEAKTNEKVQKKVDISKSSWNSIIKEKRSVGVKSESTDFVLDFGEDLPAAPAFKGKVNSQ